MTKRPAFSMPTGWNTTTLALHLYEIAVTNATDLARFARALHPRARTLRDDFSGTGALGRAWASHSTKHDAILVDRDASVLEHAGEHPRVRTLARDARRCTARCDILAATNFPLGYFHTRHDLLAYLRTAHASLTPGGTFFADMYGGEGAFTPQVQSRLLRSPVVGALTYEWEQVAASAVSGLVHNAIHFSLPGLRLERAFEYHWRLWGIAELTEAFADAGFASIEVHDSLADALDDEGNAYLRPLQADEPLDPTWVVYLCGRKQRTRSSAVKRRRLTGI